MLISIVIQLIGITFAVERVNNQSLEEVRFILQGIRFYGLGIHRIQESYLSIRQYINKNSATLLK